jgi:C-terminal processing protease CtpA/Prc
VAVDRLGTDFVMILDTEQRLVPVVLAVAPGSAAARAGWAARDLLLSIDGASLAGESWGGIAERLAAAGSRPVEVELLRAGERYLTFLVPTAPRPLG